jgi:hypothetical protein
MRLMLAMVVAAAFACGGSGGSSGAPNTFTFSASGVSPSFMMVGSAATVTFVNNDTAAHGVSSSNCSELAAASIAAGASSVISLGAGPKTCSFADALNASASSFQGSVQVASPGTPGY